MTDSFPPFQCYANGTSLSNDGLSNLMEPEIIPNNQDDYPKTPPPSNPLFQKQDTYLGCDSFRSSIHDFIQMAEKGPENRNFTICSLCSQFGFQRRRLYDVINIFESIGICQKTNVDTIKWLSMSNISPTFLKIQQLSGMHDPNSTINDIFPSLKCISITSLTKSLILCFFVLNKESLNIKSTARFLSRGNGRYKTTLCKLYQITHILEAASILSKTSTPGEVVLNSNFYIKYEPPPPPQPQNISINPYSVEYLLNHVPKTSFSPKNLVIESQ